MPNTPSSKPKKSLAEILNQVKFNPDTVKYEPTKTLIIRLLKANSLFGFNADDVLKGAIEAECRDEEETEGYIENIAYYYHNRCKYCDDRGCRICLGIDL